GFTYKTNLVWYKVRKDGGPDGRGVGFYFRNVTELVLFGTRGSLRTFQPGRPQVNIISSRKREHSRKPDELYKVIEDCSPGPYLELFARRTRPDWRHWGNEVSQEIAADTLFQDERKHADVEQHPGELVEDARHHADSHTGDVGRETEKFVEESLSVPAFQMAEPSTLFAMD